MKYKCTVKETHVYEFEIEAVDEDDAVAQINDGYHDDEHPTSIHCGEIDVSPA